MAAAVAGVFDEGGVLLAEAGTGTGKTLAYLVPAILSRQRVLISTGTKNLQEQIFFKDIPVAARGARTSPFTATCMKGRGNYLCLHRFDEFRRDSPAFRTDRRRGSFSAGHRRVGARRPRPATAPSSRTCPRTCRSGTRSRRQPRHCLGTRLPALSTSASSPGMRQRAAEVRRRHRQPPPALRRRRGAAEHATAK